MTDWPGRARGCLATARGRIRRVRLRTRVLAGVLAVILAALAGFDIAAVTGMRHYLIGQTDAQLQQVLSTYQRLDLAVPPRGHVLGLSPPGVQVPVLQQFSVQLVTARRIREVSPKVSVPGGRTVRSPALPPPGWSKPVELAGGRLVGTVPGPPGQAPWRQMQAPYRGRPAALVAWTSLGGVDKTVGQLELILLIGSAVAGLLAAAGTTWLVRRGLRPVEAMARQADRITAGDLTGRVSPADGQTEVGRLGSALNGMLSRIQGFVAEREASQRATRRFFTDASHELRTPLASLRANAQLYQQGALQDPGEVDEVMDRIVLETRRMGRLVDDMLRLARLGQHPCQSHRPVDLTAVVTECVERARVADPARTWQVRITDGLTVTGDEELLRRAIDNLLMNVLTHTPAGTAGTITASAADGCVTIEVTDDGPGVPPDHLPHIFERFYRAGARPGASGSGLGLAIVAETMSAHGGTAQAAPVSPHGLRVTLTLPVQLRRADL